MLLPGCFLLPKKKSGATASGSGQLIDRTSIYMDRVGDGDSASIRFKTTANALCQMSYYSQDPKIPPLQASPTAAPCNAKDQPQTSFNESVTGLRADTLYYVLVTAWPQGSDATHGDTVTVRETTGSQGVTNGANGVVINDLMVAQFDLPNLTAEVHRANLSAATDVDTIKGQLTRVPGCQQGTAWKDAPFRDAASPINITSLATQDLAAATATPHPDYPERLLLNYSALNQGINQWTLLYQSAGKDVQVPVSPIAQLSNIDMESTTVFNFPAATLATAPDPLAVDSTKPLKFAWTTGSNLLDLSYLTVQIGRPGYEKAIYCVFPASQRTGSVDASMLANLDSGEHVVLAELSSSLIWAKDGWVVTTSDWRWGQIQK